MRSGKKAASAAAASAGDGANDITSRVEPWSEAKRHFTKLYGLAEAAYGETNTNPYPGEFIAGENSYDKVARNQINFAQEQMAPDSIQVRRLGAQIVTGYFLDPSRNTTLVNSVNVAVDKASAALLEDVIPQVLDVAIQSGAYSGTGTELMTDRALEGFSREALRATTGIYYENWTRERSLQGSGVEMLRAAEMIEFERSKLIQANADLVRQLEDLDLQNAIAKFEDELKSHWRGQQIHQVL